MKVPAKCEHGNRLGVTAAIEGSILWDRNCALKNGKLRAHVVGKIGVQKPKPKSK